MMKHMTAVVMIVMVITSIILVRIHYLFLCAGGEFASVTTTSISTPAATSASSSAYPIAHPSSLPLPFPLPFAPSSSASTHSISSLPMLSVPPLPPLESLVASPLSTASSAASTSSAVTKAEQSESVSSAASASTSSKATKKLTDKTKRPKHVPNPKPSVSIGGVTKQVICLLIRRVQRSSSPFVWEECTGLGARSNEQAPKDRCDDKCGSDGKDGHCHRSESWTKGFLPNIIHSYVYLSFLHVGAD